MRVFPLRSLTAKALMITGLMTWINAYNIFLGMSDKTPSSMLRKIMRSVMPYPTLMKEFVMKPSAMILLISVFALFISACPLVEELYQPADEPSGPPAVPSGLDLTAVEGGIRLLWDYVENADSYRIFWTDDESDPTDESTFIDAGSACEYLHSGLSSSNIYSYSLMAMNDQGSSSLSSPVRDSPLIPPLSVPTGLTYNGTTSSEILLGWDDHGEDVTYEIYREDSDDYYGAVVETEHDSSGYADSDISTGMGYRYKIRACSSVDDRVSSYTDEVYAWASRKSLGEAEPNYTSAGSGTGYFGAQSSTSGLDYFSFSGDYDYSQQTWNAYYYKYYEWDCFRMTIPEGSEVQFSMSYGTLSGLNRMTVELIEVYESYSGGLRDSVVHSFISSGETYTYRSNWSTPRYQYVRVGMPDDLVNYGSYAYSIRFKITRNR